MAKKTKKTDPNTFANAAPNTLFTSARIRDGRVLRSSRYARRPAIDSDDADLEHPFPFRLLWSLGGRLGISCLSGRGWKEWNTWRNEHDDEAAIAWLMGR